MGLDRNKGKEVFEMNIILKAGEKVEVGFEDTEQVFEIIRKNDRIIIHQSAGYEIEPYSDDDRFEGKIIYDEEVC